MTFLAPQFLFLLPLSLLVFFVPRRIGLARGAWRAAVLMLTALAAARPALENGDTRPWHVFVVDFSTSADRTDVESAKSRLAEAMRRLPKDGVHRLVRVGEPVTVRPLDLAALASLDQDPGGAGSPLSAALAAAERAIPEGARGEITLITDGESTDGPFGAMVQRAAERDLKIHVMPLRRRGPDIYPTAIHAAESLRAGRTGKVLVDVRAVGGWVGVAVTLRSADGAIDQTIRTTVADHGTVEFPVEPRAPGFLVFTATAHATTDIPPEIAQAQRIGPVNPIGQDVDPTNDSLSAALPIDEPIRALYLGSRIDGSDAALAKLAGPGFTWDVVHPAGDGHALDGREVGDYDVCVIDDVPAAKLIDAEQQKIMSAVTERGTGLLMAGGEGAFGPGGYFDAPISKIVPVDPVQKEEKRDPSTTLVIIIDTSGSMMGTRIQLAKETARLAMRRLLPHDKCGIVEFHGAKRWAAPIQPASNSIDLQRSLNRLNAGGGTVIFPALEEAYYSLLNVQTRYKHVLILTDGGVENGPFEAVARQMSEKGITVSTVLTGPEAHSEFLVNIANWGKGRFYTAPNRYSLPEIILKQPTSARLPAYQSGEFSVRLRGAPAWTGEIDVEHAPPINGYVETRLKAGAELVLESAKGHPLLSSWRHGAGRVSALTTELAGPGTNAWKDWAGFGPLTDRMIRRTARTYRRPYEFSVERAGERLTVVARGRADEYRPEAALDVSSGEAARTFTFERRAPDLFTSDLIVDPRAEVRIVAGAAARRAGGAEPSARVRLTAPPAVVREMQAVPEAMTDLSAVAVAARGSVLPIADPIVQAPETGGIGVRRAMTPLWPWLYLAALAGYLSEIVMRRRPGAKMESNATV